MTGIMDPTEAWYALRHDRTLPSARRIMTEFLFLYPEVGSILDVGCGTGTFLAVTGLRDIRGLDCHGFFQHLVIPLDCYKEQDAGKPFDLLRRYDACLCLEMAEHLPESAAATLVENICRHSDLVLFSAAAPGQGGVGHINEQPVSHWREMFLDHGFEAVEMCFPINGRIDRSDVLKWYVENTVILEKCG